jgi:acetyltransferase-like isoleucine patch superfamily enzyme
LIRTQKLPEGRIVIGRHCVGTPYIFSFKEDNTIIGNFVSIAQGVTIIPAKGHIPPKGYENNLVSTYQLLSKFGKKKRVNPFTYNLPKANTPVEIGSDVWIGMNAIILSGVKIGHGAIIGAGSVVTHDVPPYGVVAGSPAMLLRYRYSEEQIKKLLAIQWWNWSDKKIKENLNFFYDDIDRFVDAFYVPKQTY